MANTFVFSSDDEEFSDDQASGKAVVIIGRKTLRDMARSLKTNKAILDLRESTIKTLLPFYDKATTAELAKYIKHHLDDYGSGGTRYEASTDCYSELVLEDLDKLCLFPGGTLAAIRLLPLVSAKELDHNMECEKVGWVYEDSRNIDHHGVIMIQELLKNSPLFRRKIAGTTLEAMAKERNRFRVFCEGAKLIIGEDDWISAYRYEHRYPVFKDSLRLLRAWHTREVGAMLAMKAAGHVLPPELVELIAEGFCDSESGEVLKMLTS